MRLSTSFTLLLLPIGGSLAISAPQGAIIRRDFPLVNNDLKQIDNDVKSLTQSVNAYTGTTSQVTIVNSNIDTLNRDISQANSDCQASTVYTAAQSQTLANYCNNPLGPDVKTLLTAVKNKRATFTSNGLKAVVQSQLVNLRSGFNGVTSCLASKAPTAQKSSLSSCGTTIYGYFTDAINYYS